MPGGNFSDELTITEPGGRISPTGSLGPVVIAAAEIGDEPRIHFWVIQLQDGTKGAFMQAQGARQPDNTWIMREDNIHRHGEFRVGPAFATAVAITDKGIMDWWSATIRLGLPAAEAY
jgi:hypothetical protein